MRAQGFGVLAAAGAIFMFSVPAHAEVFMFGNGSPHTEAPAPWSVQAEALAHQIQANDMIMTDRVRAARRHAAEQASGRARLQIRYDAAADDYVASAADRVAVSMPAFEREVAAQHDARFAGMAAMLRAYAPALDGDYVGARRNLEAALAQEHDPYAIAAGERFRAYALTDLGLVGNALEAERSGLAHLPADASADTLRSGLQDALSYTSIRIGDVESGFEHMQRSVELDVSAGHPVDGFTVIYNIASMMADNDMSAAAIRLASLNQSIAARAGTPAERFYADLLCAKVNFSAHNYARTLQCSDHGLAIVGAPGEYKTRLMVLRARAIARLGRGRQARQAISELRALAAQRGDPALVDKINSIEPEVLRAEGRVSEAFDALRAYHETSERTVLRRFNAGVKELRATMENEVASADERVAQQAIRTDLQAKAMQGMTLAIVLGGLCLAGAILIALLIYRSRRNMLTAVGHAEKILARRADAVGAEASDDAKARTGPTARLTNILNEIERRDIELEHAFQALEAARAAAEEANVAKSQFLTTMSHELRTPLNAIIGYSEMLLESAEEAGSEMECADLNRVLVAARRLLLLINDVLDLSKIEAGRMVAHADEVDVVELLEEIVSTVTPAASSNGNTVTLECDPKLGLASTDGLRLSQCLLNLTSNAVKFTKNGHVKIAAARETVHGADWLTFQVIDNGAGISQEAQARLFQPFVQADSSITRAHGGTGLGLAITRRLAKLLGGDVTVRSEIGAGAAFTLRVPANLQSDRPRAAVQPGRVAA